MLFVFVCYPDIILNLFALFSVCCTSATCVNLKMCDASGWLIMYKRIMVSVGIWSGLRYQIFGKRCIPVFVRFIRPGLVGVKWPNILHKIGSDYKNMVTKV